MVDAKPATWFAGPGPSCQKPSSSRTRVRDRSKHPKRGVRHERPAESTFGRRAVNDGKLAARLRNGGRITTETLDRIRAFMDSNRTATGVARPAVIDRARENRPTEPLSPPMPLLPLATPG